MSINQRLKDLIKALDLNPRSFSERIGVKDATTRSYLDRGSKPSSDYLEALTRAIVGINERWLLIGEEPMFKNGMPEPVKSKAPEQKSQMPAVVTVDSEGRDNIVLVNVKARAGYLLGYGDPEFIEMLPSYRLPGVNHGTFRMFEVEGQSMSPTLKPRDLVVSEWVENPDHMRDERIYIIVTHSEGIVIKRCINRLNKYGFILAKSDNANKLEYFDLEIKAEDIQEIWYARWYMSSQFTAPPIRPNHSSRNNHFSTRAGKRRESRFLITKDTQKKK